MKSSAPLSVPDKAGSLEAFTAGPSRRRMLGALAALPLACHVPARANDTGPIKIAQSIALTGPLGELGQAMHNGAKVCFAAINAKGGVNGRAIELVVVDDGYDTKRALANVGGFMQDRSNFALFNCMGTPMVEAMLPQVIESGMPFFAPFSGALSVRPKNARNVMNIRASYADEAEQLVQHLATVGIKRIAIAYQNNSFGKEVFAATQQAMTRYKLNAVATVTVENDSSDAAAAAQKIAASEPEAVLVRQTHRRVYQGGAPGAQGAAVVCTVHHGFGGHGQDAWCRRHRHDHLPDCPPAKQPFATGGTGFSVGLEGRSGGTGAIPPGAGGLHQCPHICRSPAPCGSQPHPCQLH